MEGEVRSNKASMETEARPNKATMETEARPNKATVEARTDKTVIEATPEAPTPESATPAPTTLGRGGERSQGSYQGHRDQRDPEGRGHEFPPSLQPTLHRPAAAIERLWLRAVQGTPLHHPEQQRTQVRSAPPASRDHNLTAIVDVQDCPLIPGFGILGFLRLPILLSFLPISTRPAGIDCQVQTWLSRRASDQRLPNADHAGRGRHWRAGPSRVHARGAGELMTAASALAETPRMASSNRGSADGCHENDDAHPA
jgi:hypothetical protein